MLFGVNRLAPIALVLVGCAGPAAAPTPKEKPGRGAAITMRDPSPELDAMAVELTGSCAFARPPGEPATYTQQVVVADTDATVFATADFSKGATNSIGQIHAGARGRAEGPIAGGRDRVSGYALVVRDREGRVCRGYVASDAVIASPTSQPWTP